MDDSARARQEIEWQFRGMEEVIVSLPVCVSGDAVAKLVTPYRAARSSTCYADLLRAVRFFYFELAEIVKTQGKRIADLENTQTAKANQKRKQQRAKKLTAIMVLSQAYRGKKTKKVAADEIAHTAGMSAEEVRAILSKMYTDKEWKDAGAASNAEWFSL